MKNTKYKIFSIKSEGKIKAFPNKQKSREYITSRSATQQRLAGVQQDEMEGCLTA